MLQSINAFVTLEDAKNAVRLSSVRTLCLNIANADTFATANAEELVTRFENFHSVEKLTADTWNGTKKAFFKWLRAESSIRSDSKEYSAIQNCVNRLFNKSYGGNKSTVAPSADSTETVEDAETVATIPTVEDAIAQAIELLKANGYMVIAPNGEEA